MNPCVSWCVSALSRFRFNSPKRQDFLSGFKNRYYIAHMISKRVYICNYVMCICYMCVGVGVVVGDGGGGYTTPMMLLLELLKTSLSISINSDSIVGALNSRSLRLFIIFNPVFKQRKTATGLIQRCAQRCIHRCYNIVHYAALTTFQRKLVQEMLCQPHLKLDKIIQIMWYTTNIVMQ